VGEYEKELIAKNCYHGSLSILENILSHLDDRGGWLVADMVAGTDTFVGALFAQFDYIFIIAEPTRNSREVVRQFEQLAIETQTQNIFKIIGNKIESEEDIAFIKSFSSELEYITSLERSAYLKKAEMQDSKFDISELENSNLSILQIIFNRICENPIDPAKRLALLRKWHYKVAMDHTGFDREILLAQIAHENVFI
jgi:CO dehydrogenase maturation factor